MKYLIVVFFLTFGLVANAQKVESNGTEYKVKGEKIFKNGEDVTDLLTEAEKLQIKNALAEKIKKEKANKEKEKVKSDLKKKEKKHKKSEKKQKKAEKELKQNEKANSRFIKAERKYEKEQKKYNRLKDKGKLSPVAEEKMLKKLKKLKSNLDKTKRKL